MSQKPNLENQNPPTRTQFEEHGEEPAGSLIYEFFQFVRDNKKWWLIPLLLMILFLGLLVWLSTTGAAPFIYTLF